MPSGKGKGDASFHVRFYARDGGPIDPGPLAGTSWALEPEWTPKKEAIKNEISRNSMKWAEKTRSLFVDKFLHNRRNQEKLLKSVRKR